MLKWHKNLIKGEKVKHAHLIRQRLNAGRALPGIYLITLSENPNNTLEIVPALTLVQESAAMMCPEIIGIASGSDEALEMVQNIIQQIYDETGDLKIKEYWENR